MATVFETRLLGNIGKDATMRVLENGNVAIQFPVAHNRNWKDKRTGELKSKTTWVNCTIWKKPNANHDLVKYLKKGTLVELYGTPTARASIGADGNPMGEIRLSVEQVNILRHSEKESDHGHEKSVELEMGSLHLFDDDQQD